MPIANGFLQEADFSRESFFELSVGFCQRCAAVQLTNLVDREQMFHEDYPFFTSSSALMVAHFGRFAASLRQELRSASPLVVELGSNDGVMLEALERLGARVLGVEPSGNVAQAAIDKGLPTLKAFFDAATAERIAGEHGKADAIVGANVFCHIPYLHSVIRGIDALLQPDGIVTFEDPYLGDILRRTSYDQIYDEHAFYFSATSVANIFGRHGFELIDAQPQAVHGGSMRYTLARTGARPQSASARELLESEKRLGLLDADTYAAFARNTAQSRAELVTLLNQLRQDGRRIVGYAATSKSTTVLNYCSIGPHALDYITDTTPLKQGRFSPGMHIPIAPPDTFRANYPDFALLFGWNHAEEILKKEQDFARQGGRWIVYVPKVQSLAVGATGLPLAGYA
jgi:methylation protein EvaC